MRRPPPDQCQLLHLPEDLLIRALSKWPAASLANLCVTCRELYALLGPAVDAAVARLGLELPRQCDRSTDHTPRDVDSLTHRLNFLQRLAARQPSRVAAGHASTLLVTSPVSTTTPTTTMPPSAASLRNGTDRDSPTELYYWGSSGGEQENIDAVLPTPVPGLPSRITIREVAAGDAHCLLLSSSDHAVYSWGADNAHGQLGHGDTAPHRQPMRIQALAAHRCAQVACGRQHSLVLTAAGDVFSFGRGSLGRLGLGATGDVHVPLLVARAACPHSATPGAPLPPLPPLPRFVRVSAGLFHSMAVSEGGHLFTWGSGTNGRLGHGDTVMQLRPRFVEALAHADIVGASAGYGHSVAWSAAGRLYTWGQGYSGRLGHGNQETKPNPALVEAMERHEVTCAVAGSEFTLALTRRGALFAFGNGDMTGVRWYGRGWEGGADRMLIPTRIKTLNDVTVAEVAAGSCHTIVRALLPHQSDAPPEHFTFGCGAQGQLGHGNLDEQLVPKRLDLGGSLSSPQSPQW